MTRRTFVGSLAAAGGGLPLLAGKAAPDAKSGRGGIAYSRTIPLVHEVDVFVAGGGPAGVCAALAAARAGKRVFLAETSGAFGGAATAAYVPSFAPFRDGVNDVVGGIGREIRNLVSTNYPIETYWTPIDMEELKRVTLESVAACAEQKITDWTAIKSRVKSNLSGYLFKTTRRSPMILPVISEI